MRKLILAVMAVSALGAQTTVLQTGTVLDGKGGTLRNQRVVIEGSKIAPPGWARAATRA